MAKYLILDTTLINIANVVRAKTGKEDAILVSDLASEIGSIQAYEEELPILDSAYPKDVTLTVIKGNTTSATFNIVFVSHGKPAEYTYQWYVDGVAVEGANSSVFVKDNLANTVNHSVYCEITNKAGTISTRVATLKVTQYYTPVLDTSYPADTSVTYNSGSSTSATFKVSIATAGVPTSYTYQWYVDGEAVSGATSSSYTKSGLGSSGTHTVYCKVTNTAGTVQSRTATLTVLVTDPQYLILNGSEIVTGSVIGNKKVSSKDGDNGNNCSKSISNGYIKIQGSRTGYGIYYVPVTLGKHTTLKMDGSFSTSGKNLVRVWSSIGTYLNDNVVAEVSYSTTGASLDVSSLSGTYYVGIVTTYNYAANIKNFYLTGRK